VPIRLTRLIIAALTLTLVATTANAEDGYDLWLRYGAPTRAHGKVTALGGDLRVKVAARELRRAMAGRRRLNGNVVLGTPKELTLDFDVKGLGAEGYLIRSVTRDGRPTIVVTGRTGAGILYGTFALIREMQLGHMPDRLNLRSTPRYPLRLLNHWDNLDGTVERGYAGPSLWDWKKLPTVDPRLVDYARANASIGINGAVLNNVNADARVLTPVYLRKVAAVADAWRPYNLRVYLSARFSAPIDIGGLPTADPLDPRVRAWWRAKADEIYRAIPDFGGFLVKANSEGQPGPATYHRSHAEGANMLAEALAPHRGTVIWRAFVYGRSKEDRAKQAYEEFRPLDGKFRPNVILQVKNGPIDFQPREPFHPLFGQMPQTQVAMEVQLTREYLGQRSGIVFLAPMWSEVLDSDTCAPRCGTPVRDTLAAVAGVANIGRSRNWTGNYFDQANWYALGRLAWNPEISPKTIAKEWTRLTWGTNARAVGGIASIMLGSREAMVDSMTPLGLAHQMATGHHYGPAPWVCDLEEPSWNPCYYARADSKGIGFDRTASGSNGAAQYAPEVARCFAALDCVPDRYLLWFHHVPWDHRMSSGTSLWDELIDRYDRGLRTIAANKREWEAMRPLVDPERHAAVAANLARQHSEAKWWRDASIAYWQSLSHLQLAPGHSAPRHSLPWYEAVRFDTVPGYQNAGTGHQPSCAPPVGGPPCQL
jgi:alpha-glucuronidase